MKLHRLALICFYSVLLLLTLGLCAKCEAAVAFDTEHSGTTGGGPSTSFTITESTGAANCLLVATCSLASGSHPTITGASLTWTYSITNANYIIAWAYSTSQLTSQTITVSGTNSIGGGIIDSYTGANGTTGIEAINSTAVVTSTTWNGSVTTLTANALVSMSDIVTATGGGSVTAGTGYTNCGGGGTGTSWGTFAEYANAVTASPGLVSPASTYSIPGTGVAVAYSIPPGTSGSTTAPPFAFALAAPDLYAVRVCRQSVSHRGYGGVERCQAEDHGSDNQAQADRRHSFYDSIECSHNSIIARISKIAV